MCKGVHPYDADDKCTNCGAAEHVQPAKTKQQAEVDKMTQILKQSQ